MQKKSPSNKSASKDISEEGLKLIAGCFKALSEINRLKLMMCLCGGEKSVGDLVAATGLGQTNVSRQLQILGNAGILVRRKDGLNVFYSVADSSIFQICNVMCGNLRKRFEGQVRAFGGHNF